MKDEDEVFLECVEDNDVNIDDIEIGGGDVEVDIDFKFFFEDFLWEVDCID